MKPKEYLVLFSLAALWGASFLFIKVAIADMTPLTLVAVRLALGALGLLLVVPFKLSFDRALRSMRANCPSWKSPLRSRWV